MSNWKIVIEGVGPCLDGDENAADNGAKMLVHALREHGHEVTRAEFSGAGKLPADIRAAVVLPKAYEDAESEGEPATEVEAATEASDPATEPANGDTATDD